MAAEVGQCPRRKLSRPEDARAPDVERVPGPGEERWVVRSPAVARQVLRDGDHLRQAGFGAETSGLMPPDEPADGDGRRRRRRRTARPPILYLEGAAHRTQRRATARFFAPKVVESYRPMMEECADALVAPLRAGRPVDVADRSMLMAVQVAGRVVGLTNSSLTGMSRRLSAFFEGDLSGGGGVRGRLRQVRTSTALLRFYWLDVKPALRARRRQPGDDLISQLLQAGYGDLEILTECVTYAAAGMATTREFITLAAWHLLDHPELLRQYRARDVEGRRALLEEVLRLEPVVGRLHRRTTAPVTVRREGADVELPAGTLVAVDLRATNTDESLVGAEAECLRPGRELTQRTFPASVLSFGDGHHRCPGGPLALMEAEVLLSRLLADDLVADGPPRVSWGAVTQGYELRRFVVRRAG